MHKDWTDTDANQRRAAGGQRLAELMRGLDGAGDEWAAESIAGAIASLMHYAASEGFNPADMLATAEIHYENEKDGD